jgi:hypothetical protein
VIALAIVLSTIASYAAGWAIGSPVVMPLLNTAAAFPFMIAALRRGNLRVAIARMLVWALAMGLCATVIAYARPWEAGRLFIRGDAYRTEMFTWVMTGRGAESTPSAFIPQQLGHSALFITLALATGSVVAMPMGAALMNYMGTYVGSLAAAGRRPLTTALLAWHPWAVVRIISFVTLGVVLATPIWSRVLRARIDWRDARKFVGLALAGLVLDIVLKALFAAAWQRLLVRVVGW